MSSTYCFKIRRPFFLITLIFYAIVLCGFSKADSSDYDFFAVPTQNLQINLKRVAAMILYTQGPPPNLNLILANGSTARFNVATSEVERLSELRNRLLATDYWVSCWSQYPGWTILNLHFVSHLYKSPVDKPENQIVLYLSGTDYYGVKDPTEQAKVAREFGW